MTDDFWYILYIAAMAAGALLFFAWSRNPKGVPKDEYWVAMVIPIWSGLAYLAMLTGQGVIQGPDGEPLYLARYLDWVVTTPLLLWALASTAHFHRPHDRPLLAGLIVTDIIMILSGLMADLAIVPWVRWLWFAVGVSCLLIIINITWGRLRRDAYHDGAELGKAYDKVAAFLSVAWIGYPLIWALGPTGADVIGSELSIPLQVLLPIASKVGFSILDLHELRKIGEKRPGYQPARMQEASHGQS
ncbi:MAG: bacteriorhodopsin [Litorimonas sp.]